MVSSESSQENSREIRKVPEKQSSYLKVVKHLSLAAMALAGCQAQGKDVRQEVLQGLSQTTMTELLTEEPSVDQKEFDFSGLNKAVIEPGDSIVSAIDKFHGSEGMYNTYLNLGLVVMRNGEPSIYFDGKLAIDYSGLLGNLAGLQPGDEIVWGKSGDVAVKTRGIGMDMMRVSGYRINCNSDTGVCMDQLRAFGGNLEQPITMFYQEGESDGWKADVGGNTFSDLNQALEIAQTPRQD